MTFWERLNLRLKHNVLNIFWENFIVRVMVFLVFPYESAGDFKEYEEKKEKQRNFRLNKTFITVLEITSPY